MCTHKYRHIQKDRQRENLVCVPGIVLGLWDTSMSRKVSILMRRILQCGDIKSFSMLIKYKSMGTRIRRDSIGTSVLKSVIRKVLRIWNLSKERENYVNTQENNIPGKDAKEGESIMYLKNTKEAMQLERSEPKGGKQQMSSERNKGSNYVCTFPPS